MSHSADLRQILYRSGFRIHQRFQHQADRRRMILHLRFRNLFLPAGRRVYQPASVNPNSLTEPLRDQLLALRIDQLKLQRGASTVYYQNIHCLPHIFRRTYGAYTLTKPVLIRFSPSIFSAALMPAVPVPLSGQQRPRYLPSHILWTGH